MNDDRLVPTVSDWLKETDTPPRDTRASVQASVARAGGVRQARRRWPTRGVGWTVSHRAMAGMLAAFVLVAILGAAMVLQPTTPEHDASVAPGASPPAAGSDLRDYSAWWIADSMVLRTSTGALLNLGPLNAEMGVDPSDPSGRWTMEDGWPMGDPVLFVAFDSDGIDWWLDEVRVFGRDAGVTYTADELDMRGPVGDWWQGVGVDVEIQLVADTRARKNQRATATLELEELRLAILPPHRNGPQEGDPIAWILGQVGELARAVAFWDRPSEEIPGNEDATPLMVTVPFGDLTLTGELLDGGVVRVVDDGSGNNLQRARDIAVTDDGAVSIARDRKILTLGQPGFVSVDSGGPDGITRIEPGPDGSLDVYGATELKRLSGETWSSLETPPELMESALDGYWPKRMPDGSLWGTSLDGSYIGRRDGDTWTSWSLDELVQTLTPGPLEAVSAELTGGADGEVWAVIEASRFDSTRAALAHYDGESWRTVDEVIAGGLAATEAAVVRDLDIGPGGTVWVLVDVLGRGQDLYRYAAQAWSSTPVSAIETMAGARQTGASEIHAGPGPGQVQLRTMGDRHSLLFDGESAVESRQRPFRLRARSPDGSLWGVGPQARDGLLMIPATEPASVNVPD